MRRRVTLAPALSSSGATVPPWVEQRQQHVGRLDELIVAANAQRLGIGQRRLEAAGELVHAHRGLTLRVKLPNWG